MFNFLRMTLFLPLIIASCATMRNVKDTSVTTTKSITDFALGRPQVAIVAAREKDMKQMPLGKERALAFEQARTRSFWSFALPNFKEPTLPSVRDNTADGSLLPPKS
jgi:hypothetical protein